MINLPSNESLHMFLNRASVRKYTGQKISAEIFDKIIQAGIQAPTSSHIQAFSIINITNHEIREKIFKISGNQQWILDASHFLILCADLFKIQHLSNPKITEEEISQDAYLASLLDSALVGMTLSLAAETFNIGSVMIGSIRNNIADIANILNLPKGVMPVFGLCLGYYNERKKPKPRLAKELFVFENTYSLPQNANELLQDYHKRLKKYYEKNILEHEALRTQTDKTWLDVVSSSVKNQKRFNMGDDLSNQGFNLSSKRF